MKSKLLIFWIRCRLGWFRWHCSTRLGIGSLSRFAILIEINIIASCLFCLCVLFGVYVLPDDVSITMPYGSKGLVALCFILAGVYAKLSRKNKFKKMDLYGNKLTKLYEKHNFNYIDQIAVDKLYTFSTSIIPAFLLSVFSIIILSSDKPLDWALIAGIILLLALNIYFLFRLLSNLIQFINLTK